MLGMRSVGDKCAVTMIPMTDQERARLIARYRREWRAGVLLVAILLVFAGLLLVLRDRSDRPAKQRVSLVLAAICVVTGVIPVGYGLWLRIAVKRDLAAGVVGEGRAHVLRKTTGMTKAQQINRLHLDALMPRRSIRVSDVTYARVNQGDIVEVRFFPRSKVILGVTRI